jgi:hypothetical protein
MTQRPSKKPGRESDGRLPPMRFVPLQRIPAQGSRIIVCPCLRRTPSAFRFSQPPDAFTHPRACWPYFMPDPLLGFHPPELCSSRAAVRRLRRLLPSWCSSDLPAPLATKNRCSEEQSDSPCPRKAEGQIWDIAPPSGSCSARDSATKADGLDRQWHVALLGFLPFRVIISPE